MVRLIGGEIRYMRCGRYSDPSELLSGVIFFLFSYAKAVLDIRLGHLSGREIPIH
jgi:hypothetical protein